MKSLMSIALCFLVCSGSVFADDSQQPELVKIQSIDGKVVWVTKDVLKDTYNRTFGISTKPTLSPVEKAKLTLQVRQDGYAWAYSAAGLGLNSTDAQKFAESMATRENPMEAFAAYKTAYQFAYSASGIGQNGTDARNLADKLSRLDSPQDMIEIFKTAYRYAYSASGMGLNSTDALAYALKAVGSK